MRINGPRIRGSELVTSRSAPADIPVRCDRETLNINLCRERSEPSVPWLEVKGDLRLRTGCGDESAFQLISIFSFSILFIPIMHIMHNPSNHSSLADTFISSHTRANLLLSPLLSATSSSSPLPPLHGLLRPPAGLAPAFTPLLADRHLCACNAPGLRPVRRKVPSICEHKTPSDKRAIHYQQ